jgi:hypothetical protein
MQAEDVVKHMPIWYEAKTPVHLESSPGLGKTTTIDRAPKLLSDHFGKNFGYAYINGANTDLTDVQGYLTPVHHEKYSESRFTRPWYWTTPEGKQLEEYDGGILFIDERDKMAVECKKIMGEARLSGRLGTHYLPPGWLIWTAGNTAADRSGSTKELDHLINRERRIKFEITVDGWTEHVSKRENALSVILSFANNNPEVVFQSKVPDKQGPWCTPRSLMEVNRYLQVVTRHSDGNLPLDGVICENIAGSIGEAASLQLVNTLKLDKDMPKIADIVKDPSGAKVPERPDAQMLVAFKLAHSVTEDTAGAIITYISRMPKEFGVTFAKSAGARMPKLVSTPAFLSWAMKNSSLMATLLAMK